MKAVFLSDLHLEQVDSPQFRAFRDLLQQVVQQGKQVFILGDLVEVWVGDDDDAELACEVKNSLRECVQSVNVCIMHGNRDFLYGEAFETETGVKVIPDPYVLQCGDERILLAHGDAYCTKDMAYQQMRAFLRSPNGISGLLQQTLEQRRALARQLRQASKQANELKADNIMDVTLEEIQKTIQDYQCSTMIHGHTHRPAIHKESWGKRYVLGNWESCGWYLDLSSHALELRCFAIE
ncbi:MAG: UDP-2,3-diacylglucosamine diphosphatase [Gammaproteobacteria bacterium]|nr:UDP-2,3-diacylglucosamine diphosphatase [Gammaproteobacteria bacterium]